MAGEGGTITGVAAGMQVGGGIEIDRVLARLFLGSPPFGLMPAARSSSNAVRATGLEARRAARMI
jgi:hypothetical protein